MSQQRAFSNPPSLDLWRWRQVPAWLIVIGGVGALIGWIVPGLRVQFAYSWLLAYMFFLSICLGSLALVLLHHLFDASWSVGIRRVEEHIAYLLPVMAILFVPVAIMARAIYPWMTMDPHDSHALHAKQPLFTMPMFYVVAVLCLAVWWLLSYKLRSWSLRQDQTGEALCTYRLRRWSAGGIFLYAFTLTLAAVMWVKALQHHWFSTIYGVYYFAGSVWMTIATIYVLAAVLQRTGHLRDVVNEQTYYFLGTLQLAFTVFYAYIHFSQYFIIWNANIPEETFWYKLRETGGYWNVGLILIFGHFFVPFLALLRIDAKHYFPLMAFLCVWAWIMHYFDLAFNIMPVAHPDGFPVRWLWLDLACIAFIGGILVRLFLREFFRHPAYPIKDPRLAEALGHYHPRLRLMSGGELGETEEIEDEMGESPDSDEPLPGGAK
jgi:hypothetical protein